MSKQSILKMSKFTTRMMKSINYDSIRKTRIQNFKYLNSKFKSINEINVNLNLNEVPMVYPLVIYDKRIREELLHNHIYIAKYWPNVKKWVEKNSIEYIFYEYLLPIPIDQRYKRSDMIYICNLMNKIKRSYQ